MTRVVGLISGTSLDAIDVAAAEFVADGDRLTLRRLGETEVALPAALRGRVLAALPPAATTTEELCRLDVELGAAFAAAAEEGVAGPAEGRADVIVSHGQTLHHDVVDGVVRGTLQLGQPAEIAERTGLDVVADLRTRDVAAGGQGAPLVALLDELLLADRPAAAACCNLGGIANLTVVAPAASTLAFDAGPANALLDLAVRRDSDGASQHDAGGALAAGGRVDAALLEALLADPYLHRDPPKTTGKERYHGGHLDAALAAAPVSGLADQLATLAAAAARAVVEAAVRLEVAEVFVSGGGVHNRALMGHLEDGFAAHGVRMADTSTLGLPVDAKEAYAMALLGYLSWHGLPGNVPSATGARGPRVLGSITPGEGARRPGPARSVPRRLAIAPPGTTSGHRGTYDDGAEEPA